MSPLPPTSDYQPRLRGNNSSSRGGMSDVFNYDENKQKQSEEDRRKQIEERKLRELENNSMQGAAGVTSVFKNVELARYHEDQ